MPLDAAARKVVDTSEDGQFAALIHSLPEDEQAIFSERHLEALREACRRMKWGDHPINIRLSIPAIFKRFYVVFVAGPERRSAERRVQERRRHPLGKVGNLIFVGVLLAVGLYAAVFLQTLFFVAYYELFMG